MNAEKWREKDGRELRDELGQVAEKLFRIQFQMGMGQLEGLKNYRQLKKDRARILTILREREIETAGAGGGQ